MGETGYRSGNIFLGLFLLLVISTFSRLIIFFVFRRPRMAKVAAVVTASILLATVLFGLWLWSLAPCKSLRGSNGVRIGLDPMPMISCRLREATLHKYVYGLPGLTSARHTPTAVAAPIAAIQK